MVDTKLYSLAAVYECGSFVGAAKKLSITQPAVSQHIKALENELGVIIFERVGGKLSATKQGELAIRFAQKVIGLSEELKSELREGNIVTDHLTIGITRTAESNPIAAALAKYCAENDSISIKIITDTAGNLYKMLKTYELDIAVVESRQSDDDFSFLLLDTDYLVLAVPPKHPLASKDLITFSELKKERLILRLPSSGTRSLFKAHLESNNMSVNDFNIIMEIDNVATIKDLVRRGFGVSILPKSVCLEELKNGSLSVLPVENLSMTREIIIAYRNDFTHSDILRDIVHAYKETVRIYR
ncbi:MAG: LysR family transcriptional regulator [Clostridia bacterium]|nr:LysR family transcriptional regulator [Clostridia bacterium]